MKVKCCICKKKGYFQLEVSEYYASQFLMLMWGFNNSKYICRDCINKVLGTLKSEQYRINELYKPKIKEKKEFKQEVKE